MDDDSVSHKSCSTCGAAKPLESFVLDKRKPSGRGARCRDCQRVAGLKSYYSVRLRKRTPEQLTLVFGKRCSACKLWKAFDGFHRNPQTTDGHQAWCKSCTAAQRREALSTPEARERVNQRAAERRRTDPAFREKAIQASRAWYKGNREKAAAWGRGYYQDNRERIQARHQEWRAANPEQMKVYHYRWLSRKEGNGGSFTLAEWQALCKRHESRCLCCGEEVALTVDHIVPVSKGGRNDIENIQPLCGSCNSRKGAQTIDFRPQVE